MFKKIKVSFRCSLNHTGSGGQLVCNNSFREGVAFVFALTVGCMENVCKVIFCGWLLGQLSLGPLGGQSLPHLLRVFTCGSHRDTDWPFMWSKSYS